MQLRSAGYSVDPAVTSWAKVLNAEYSQAEGRHELLNGDSR